MDEKRAKLHHFHGRSMLLLIFLIAVDAVHGAEVSFQPEYDGYLLRSPFTRMARRVPLQQKDHLLITKDKLDTNIKVSLGPFSANATVLDQLPADISNVSSAFAQPLGLSVTIINNVIAPDEPLLQVLAHSSHLGNSNSQQKWCFRVHVHHDRDYVIASCVLTNSLHICMLKATLPIHWWTGAAKSVESAKVFYSVNTITERWQCASAQNSIVPGKSQSESTSRKVFLSSVSLANTPINQYRRVSEDQHILLDIPTRTYHPGSKFSVPIYLQAESNLRLFVIRVRARHGLKVANARATNPSTWLVNTHFNHKQKRAMVTAFVKDSSTYSKLPSVQEVFQFDFEVDATLRVSDTGRLVFHVQYEATGGQLDQRPPKSARRLVANIGITGDMTRIIHPIAKTTEILNTAILTGRHLTFPIKVYAVSYQGYIKEVTRRATCTSQDVHVLKVSSSCSVAYVDGSETAGSTNITINIKYGNHRASLHFTVWIPALPLEVTLSDSKLSPIKGWKVARGRQKRSKNRRKNKHKKYLTSHPSLILKGSALNGYGAYRNCQTIYQHAVVEVYSRFYIKGARKNQYLPSKKASLRVTDLVLDKLRIADSSIAQLAGHIVHGKHVGRTEVQVVSAAGPVIGTRELWVIPDRVTIKNILVKTVAGISVSLAPWKPMMNTYIATVHHWKLQREYQEATLDVQLQFSDNAVIPLKYISPANYRLAVLSLNKNVVRIGKPYGPSLPKVIALREGKGELLKVSLDSARSCVRKRFRPLAVSYVNIDVNFSKGKYSAGHIQNDGHFNSMNRANNPLVKNTIEVDKSIIHLDLDKRPVTKNPETIVKAVQGVRREKVANIPIGIELSKLAANKQSPESLKLTTQLPVVKKGLLKAEMTPLEIGMYVLLAVFCVAIVVFMANCIVFVLKYRRKRVPKDSMESIAHAGDWVWLGRTTLERNSVNTQCSQALMSRSDFKDEDQHGNTPCSSGHNSVCSSNRNSNVSTYKGSECSIRITTNPGAEDEGATTGEDSIKWDTRAMGMTHDELVKYFHDMKESTA